MLEGEPELADIIVRPAVVAAAMPAVVAAAFAF